MMKPLTRLLPVLAVLASILSVQVGASFSKQLFPVIGAEGTTALRQGFAAVILLILFRPWQAAPARQHWGLIALYSALLGVMNLTFYLAIARLPLGIGVALEFIGPLTVAVLSSRRAIDFVWVVCAVSGLLILLPWHQGAGPIDLIGVAFALVAAACWGGYIIIGQRVSQRVDGAKAVAIGMALTTLFTVPLGVWSAGAAMASPKVLMWGVAVAVLSSAIPYSCEMWALKRLPARTFSLMMSLEPAVAALMGFLILAEHLSLWQWLAIGLVIAASAGSSLTSRQTPDE
ncbi:MAG: EamA family transporter, partial [Asticcacaulis sp.]